MPRNSCAWRFDSDKTMDQMVSQLNTAGSWKWQVRESHWYCDYLNCRPGEGVRVRILDLGEPMPPKFQRSAPNYMMQVDIDTKPGSKPSHLDIRQQYADVFNLADELLAQIGARNICETETYD